MKILIATDCYIYNMGGITASVLALCSGLRNLGHEVKVLALSNSNKSFKDENNYFIRSIPALYYPGMRISFAKKDQLLRELVEWQPEIIHVQTEGSARRFSKLIQKRCDATMIMTCHTDYGQFIFGNRKNNPFIKGMMSNIGYILYRKTTRLTVPSEKASKFPFLSKMKNYINVVPNGMELEKYRNKFSKNEREEFRESIGIDNNTKTLVSISRLSKEKNIRELIAFLPDLKNKYKEVKLLIVGDGPDINNLKRMVKTLQLNNNVIFTGKIPSEDVWKYYAAGDIFVSGSTFEVHSMSYLEALANGLPLLCRKDEALKGVLDHNKNGFMYSTKDEYIDYAYKMLVNDDIRSKMAKKSYKKAENFSTNAFATSMIEVYKKALNENKRKEYNNDKKCTKKSNK